MKQIKRISLVAVLIVLLTACGLGAEDVPTDGLTASMSASNGKGEEIEAVSLISSVKGRRFQAAIRLA